MKAKTYKSAETNNLGKKGGATSFVYYAPQADKVSIVGNFNNWNTTKTPLKKASKGNWKVELKLAPGRYEYRYLVDGTWQNDQRPVECVPNSFGSWNCVIEVR
ncbi:MAG: isoamylase early set domain-containing protein [Candidatus Omnitrophica bacterium]|nr:isoamylase early set domain-containing protein [Candidatus Omnitrophota bacterium]